MVALTMVTVNDAVYNGSKFIFITMVVMEQRIDKNPGIPKHVADQSPGLPRLLYPFQTSTSCLCLIPLCCNLHWLLPSGNLPWNQECSICRRSIDTLEMVIIQPAHVNVRLLECMFPEDCYLNRQWVLQVDSRRYATLASRMAKGLPLRTRVTPVFRL